MKAVAPILSLIFLFATQPVLGIDSANTSGASCSMKASQSPLVQAARGKKKKGGKQRKQTVKYRISGTLHLVSNNCPDNIGFTDDLGLNNQIVFNRQGVSMKLANGNVLKGKGTPAKGVSLDGTLNLPQGYKLFEQMQTEALIRGQQTSTQAGRTVIAPNGENCTAVYSCFPEIE